MFKQSSNNSNILPHKYMVSMFPPSFFFCSFCCCRWWNPHINLLISADIICFTRSFCVCVLLFFISRLFFSHTNLFRCVLQEFWQRSSGLRERSSQKQKDSNYKILPISGKKEKNTTPNISLNLFHFHFHVRFICLLRCVCVY